MRISSAFDQMILVGTRFGSLTEDVDRPDYPAGIVSDRLNVDECDNARAIRPFDRDLLVAHSLSGRERLGHRTFGVGQVIAVHAE